MLVLISSFYTIPFLGECIFRVILEVFKNDSLCYYLHTKPWLSDWTYASFLDNISRIDCSISGTNPTIFLHCARVKQIPIRGPQLHWKILNQWHYITSSTANLFGFFAWIQLSYVNKSISILKLAQGKRFFTRNLYAKWAIRINVMGLLIYLRETTFWVGMIVRPQVLYLFLPSVRALQIERIQLVNTKFAISLPHSTLDHYHK